MRHNEDITNVTLAKNSPFDAFELMKNMPMWDPHLKAFLLIQSHVRRIDSPNSEYITDQNTVLDQVVRIIQAGIDTMTELNRLDCVYALIHLLQSVKSARWPDDYPLSILPGVSEEWDDAWEGKVPRDLNNLAVLANKPGRDVLDNPMNTLLINGAQRRSEFIRAVRYLPDLDLKATGSAESSKKPEADECQINLTLTRKNQLVNPEAKIYAPRFQKSQTEGFFALVTASSASGRISNEVSALKRIAWNVSKTRSNNSRGSRVTVSTTARLKLEPVDFDREVDVVVMSDCYPGMEWRVEKVLVPARRKELKIESVEIEIDEGLVRKARMRKEQEEKQARDKGGEGSSAPA